MSLLTIFQSILEVFLFDFLPAVSEPLAYILLTTV